MKNKTIGLFIVSIIFLVSFTSSFAIFGVNPTIRVEKENERENRQASRSGVRDDFKLKLSTIRDTKKQEKVDRINSRLPEINKKRTEEMNAILDRLQNVLNRIANSKFEIRNSKLDELIITAQKAIDDARAAVLAQAQKDYVVTITTEGQLRVTVGQTVSGMEQDLRLTREKVIAARKAVVDAYAELMRLKGKEASGSGALNK